jgi:hypothetical protein
MSPDRRAEVARLLPRSRPPTDDEWAWIWSDYGDDWDAGGAEYLAEKVRQLRRAFGASPRLQHRVELPPRGWQEHRVRDLARLYVQLAEQEVSVQHLRAEIDGSAVRAALTDVGDEDAASRVPGAPEPSALIAWIMERYRQALDVEPNADQGAVHRALARHKPDCHRARKSGHS